MMTYEKSQNYTLWLREKGFEQTEANYREWLEEARELAFDRLKGRD